MIDIVLLYEAVQIWAALFFLARKSILYFFLSLSKKLNSFMKELLFFLIQ